MWTSDSREKSILDKHLRFSKFLPIVLIENRYYCFLDSNVNLSKQKNVLNDVASKNSTKHDQSKALGQINAFVNNYRLFARAWLELHWACDG